MVFCLERIQNFKKVNIKGVSSYETFNRQRRFSSGD